MSDIFDLKLEIFCLGVRIDERFRREILEHDGYVDKRASLSSGICLSIDGKSVVNAAVLERFVPRSPFFLTKRDGRWILLRNGEEIEHEIEPIPHPEWYGPGYKTKSGIPFRRLVQIHGFGNLTTCISNRCYFWRTGERCRFCAIEAGDSLELKRMDDLIEATCRIWEDFGAIDLGINSGTFSGFTIEPFISIVSGLRNAGCSIPIYVQAHVPKDSREIERLYDAGADTIGFNIEVYDEQLRRFYCPGKSRISLDHYLKMLEEAVRIFGENQVVSWLIAGLEPPESTLKGAEELASRGVIPFVTIFRPLLGSMLEDRDPVRPESVRDLYIELSDILKDYGIRMEEHRAGCVVCGGCSPQVDLI